MRGGDGVPWPAAGADFLDFLRDFSLVFLGALGVGIRRTWNLRPCYHALRQPVGAADRALLRN